MKARIIVICIALAAAGCTRREDITAIGPASAKAIAATATADYELVAPFPDRPGIYKFFDLESGLVCHVTVGPEGAYSHNTVSSISCNPDTRTDAQFPGTAP